jgi:hypothetical protein
VTFHSGPYYPSGKIGIVPRAYDIFRAYEGMEEETIKMCEKSTYLSLCPTKGMVGV